LIANSAAFSPDGTRIVTASDNKTARIWDAASAKEIAALRGHGKALNFAAFSPDGTRIVTASWDETARIWDAHFATMSPQDLMREVCTWLGPGLTTLSPDEMRLVGYLDDTVQIDVCAGIR
jgi:WD40 repeat protein